MADCLNNSVIVRKILQHFSTTELLELSFVNKLWNYEARSEIKIRGNTIARLRSSENRTCKEDFAIFAHFIQQINVVPISGIHIDLDYCRHDCPCPAMDPPLETILDRLLLKSFSVKLHHTWWEYKDCPAFVLAKTILQRCNETLEEISLDIWSGREHFIETVLVDFNFPRLRVLKLEETMDEGLERYMNYMKALVSLAPNLQELHSGWTIETILKVLEGTSVVLVRSCKVWAPFCEISESFINHLRFDKLELGYSRTNFDFDRFNRMTPMLLQTCCTTTLRSIAVEAELALPLVRFESCLKNVKDFTMWIDYYRLKRHEPRILRIFKGFDFNRIFPSLRKVKMSGRRSHRDWASEINGFVEQVQATWREPLPDRAVNIKHMHLDGTVADLPVEFLAEMFPSIQELRVDGNNADEISFESISNHWANLKKLELRRNVVRCTGNFESIICGIFPEEVVELRQKDEEYLRGVHIVPVKSAISCLRNLRTFTINYCSDYNVHTDRLNPTTILSKVTAWVAFARCPHIAVNLRTSCQDVYEEIKHLKPYASVVYM